MIFNFLLAVVLGAACGVISFLRVFLLAKSMV